MGYSPSEGTLVITIVLAIVITVLMGIQTGHMFRYANRPSLPDSAQQHANWHSKDYVMKGKIVAVVLIAVLLLVTIVAPVMIHLYDDVEKKELEHSKEIKGMMYGNIALVLLILVIYAIGMRAKLHEGKYSAHYQTICLVMSIIVVVLTAASIYVLHRSTRACETKDK